MTNMSVLVARPPSYVAAPQASEPYKQLRSRLSVSAPSSDTYASQTKAPMGWSASFHTNGTRSAQPSSWYNPVASQDRTNIYSAPPSPMIASGRADLYPNVRNLGAEPAPPPIPLSKQAKTVVRTVSPMRQQANQSPAASKPVLPQGPPMLPQFARTRSPTRQQTSQSPTSKLVEPLSPQRGAAYPFAKARSVSPPQTPRRRVEADAPSPLQQHYAQRQTSSTAVAALSPALKHAQSEAPLSTVSPVLAATSSFNFSRFAHTHSERSPRPTANNTVSPIQVARQFARPTLSPRSAQEALVTRRHSLSPKNSPKVTSPINRFLNASPGPSVLAQPSPSKQTPSASPGPSVVAQPPPSKQTPSASPGPSVVAQPSPSKQTPSVLASGPQAARNSIASAAVLVSVPEDRKISQKDSVLKDAEIRSLRSQNDLLIQQLDALKAAQDAGGDAEEGKTRTEKPNAEDTFPDMGTSSFDFFKIATMKMNMMPTHDRHLATKIRELLSDRATLKTHVVRCFEKATDGYDELDLERLRVFRDLLAGAINVPAETFSNFEKEYVDFDFDGTGELGMNAAYKLVKFSLKDHHRRLGGTPATANIELKDLKTAGFTIKRNLGQGNQGIAKLASDRDSKDVCIKCYQKDRMTESAVEELRQEFEALRLLQCERIAGVAEIFQDSSMYYMVCEPYYGGNFMTLKQRAKEQGVVTNEEWYRTVFRQCFEGLAFMHEQAMMHCDIKEPNLMLKTNNLKNPDVIIIDLGVSTCMAAVESGIPHGTPGYIPPEVLEIRKWFPKGDVFSMGVCICQIMTDKLPPMGPRNRNTPGGIFMEGCTNVREIFDATRNRVPPLHLMPEAWPQLTLLVESLLEKDREKRPSAPQALNDPWFRKASGENTWRFQDRFRNFRSKNRFASVGITHSFMLNLGQCEGSDDDETDGDRTKQLLAELDKPDEQEQK